MNEADNGHFQQLNEREALEEAVKRAPNVAARRLVLADWYEENGEAARAEALRWMLTHNKKPVRCGPGFVWVSSTRLDCGYEVLPVALFEAVRS